MSDVSMADRAVVLAGGRGRARAYTTVLPKPLLAVGDRAILGPTALDRGPRRPLRGMNSDVITTLGYRAFLKAHGDAGSHRRVVHIDYGVLHLNDEPSRMRRIVGFEEKPQLRYTVSMVVYALKRRAIGEFQQLNKELWGDDVDLPGYAARVKAADA